MLKREIRVQVAELCAQGKSALDEIPHGEAVAVASQLLRRIQQLAPNSNVAILAGAGLVLRQSFALFRTFEAIESASPQSSPVVLLATLGSRLPGPEGRALLAYLAELPRLDERSRMLAREGRTLNHRLVFDALRGKLPERLSPSCSPALREELLELHLMLQQRPLPKQSLWLRLAAWMPSFWSRPAYQLVRLRA